MEMVCVPTMSRSIGRKSLGDFLGTRQVRLGIFSDRRTSFKNLIRESLHSMLVTPVVYESEPIGLLTLRRSSTVSTMTARLPRLLRILSHCGSECPSLCPCLRLGKAKEERTHTWALWRRKLPRIRNLMVIRLLFDSLELEAGDENKNKDLA